MLTHIHIQNFTIVKSLSLDFQAGLNILTGETGAGKSIWVDAVGLALGDRADNNAIRHGEDRCDITLCFDISKNTPAKHWLKTHEFEADGECILRRTLSRNASSRATINGTPCPLQLLKQFSTLVLDAHSQHQHQTLLKRDAQRHKLDAFAGNEKLIDQIAAIYSEWRVNQTELDVLNAKAGNADAELTLLRYQLDELVKCSIQDNEWKTLSQKHQQLHNAKALMSQLNNAINITVENESASASHLLQQALMDLEAIKTDDPVIKSARELLNTAAIHLQEAGNELTHYRDHLDLSPENLAAIETRLSLMHDLARKHHIDPSELSSVEKSLSKRIHDLEQVDVLIAEIEAKQTALTSSYQTIAKKLSAAREKAAKTLNKKITAHIRALGIEGGVFRIALNPQNESISLTGNEQIEFEVITNPGQAFQPMQKVVSGGELSRISLALQVMTAQKNNTPTLIFDEVDVGIGGKTADVVGDLLRELSDKTQVLCITHLPQVAARGHHHFKAEKTVGKKEANTNIRLLSHEERVEEIARMLGGAKITKQVVAHAEEILG